MFASVAILASASSDYDSGYVVGAAFATIAIAAVVCWLVIRFWPWKTGDKASPPDFATHSTLPQAGSIPPATRAYEMTTPAADPKLKTPTPVIAAVIALAAVLSLVRISHIEAPGSQKAGEAEHANFMRGCTNGVPESSCQCIYDRLLAAGYDTKGEIRDLDEASAGQTPPPVVVQAAQQCVGTTAPASGSSAGTAY